ncbi:MAG: hypothetical protein ACMUHM_09185 [Thermoplasmatota archaeon]
MEAVWKRILLLLLVGVLLTLIVFPIVRAQPVEEKREPMNGWVSTKIEVVHLSPPDNTVPPDGRIDLEEDFPEEFIFAFRLVVEDMWTIHGQPVPLQKVWLNITMGPYTNSSFNYTDHAGMVLFKDFLRLTDTKTGNPFSIPAEQNRANITLQANFGGSQGYTSSIRTIFATYHRTYIDDDYLTNEPNPIFCFIFFIELIIIAGFIYSLVLACIRVDNWYSDRKDKRFYKEQMNKVISSDVYPEIIPSIVPSDRSCEMPILHERDLIK